jgi:hypothetical protein
VPRISRTHCPRWQQAIPGLVTPDEQSVAALVKLVDGRRLGPDGRSPPIKVIDTPLHEWSARMAKRVIEVLTSDLSGADLGDDGQTIEFSYQGVDYSIDLTKKEANDFDKSLTRYTTNARRVVGRKKKTASPSSASTAKEKTQAVREWA